jgi:predicted nucleic acid-binding protein
VQSADRGGGAPPDSIAETAVILDTNVFVGAGFNPHSHSARLVDAVRTGRLRLVWNDATRRETERILRQIPRLAWEPVAPLFRDENRFEHETHPGDFNYVPDPADRKFAALADAAGVPLVTSDADLLQGRDRARVPILTPSEFVEHIGQGLPIARDRPRRSCSSPGSSA